MKRFLIDYLGVLTRVRREERAQPLATAEAYQMRDIVFSNNPNHTNNKECKADKETIVHEKQVPILNNGDDEENIDITRDWILINRSLNRTFFVLSTVIVAAAFTLLQV